jgi:putative methyltransferase (TIGR04325 family)
MKAKKFIKELVPPLLLRKISSLFYGWHGNYSSWEEAASKTSGYQSDKIFNRVKEASLMVKDGEAVFERDSVIFDKVHYSFPVLSALAITAIQNKGKLNVLDFGGALGSSYYQNRLFFKDLERFNWCVVEQNHFVEEGQKNFADKHLHFFYDIENCMQSYDIDILLLSGVLQYLEKPYHFLESILSKNIQYIIIDRQPLTSLKSDRITIQTVPKNIYKAQYPCWILNEKKLLDCITTKYDLMFEQKTEETINLNETNFKAFFFKRSFKVID